MTLSTTTCKNLGFNDKFIGAELLCSIVCFFGRFSGSEFGRLDAVLYEKGDRSALAL